MHRAGMTQILTLCTSIFFVLWARTQQGRSDKSDYTATINRIQGNPTSFYRKRNTINCHYLGRLTQSPAMYCTDCTVYNILLQLIGLSAASWGEAAGWMTSITAFYGFSLNRTDLAVFGWWVGRALPTILYCSCGMARNIIDICICI